MHNNNIICFWTALLNLLNSKEKYLSACKKKLKARKIKWLSTVKSLDMAITDRIRSTSPTCSLNTVCTEFTDPDNKGYSVRNTKIMEDTKQRMEKKSNRMPFRAREAVVSGVGGLMLLIPGTLIV